MSRPLEDKVVLITGASRGVGEACALACAKAGAHLVLAGKTLDPHPTLPGTLPEVAEQIDDLERDALVVPCDVRFEDQVEGMIEQTMTHYGRLDAVVNNAGAIFLSNLSDWPVKRFDLVMGVNVRGAFLVSKAAMPHLRVRGGHIVMMSPPVVSKAATTKGPYLVSKLGMTILAEAIDNEEPSVAAHALWPVTALKTAATINFNMVEDGDWRQPEILADATVALLARDPFTSTFRAWLDEEVLQAEGLTDFTRYRVDPNKEPQPWSIKTIDPDWQRA